MLAALLASFTLAATASPPPGIDAAALPVRGGPWHGSAVVWSREAGLLLTALHVVEEMPSIEVQLPGGAFVPARIVDRDPVLDLALVEVAASGLPPALPVAARPVRAGAAVWLAGCPGLRCGATAGQVTAAVRAFAGSRYLEVRAEARPGASGGAVLDDSGALVGITDLTLRDRPGVALAIPVERALERFVRPPAVTAARLAAVPAAR